MIKVGIIGCGAIGTTLAEAIDSGVVNNVELVALFDLFDDRIETLVQRLNHKPKKYCEFEVFLRNGGTDIIVEAASQQAVISYSERVITSGKDILIMSTGALLDKEFLKRIKEAAKKHGRQVQVPSGAIGGLDVVKAAKLGGLERVVSTIRKNPESLKASPYSQRIVKNLDDLKEPKIIFQGCANDAVKLFPSNTNVSAALSLAGIGGQNTVVRVIVDPTITMNIHEIEVKGKFGKMKIQLENYKHPSNPKTSYLAVLSAIEALRSNISGGMKVGT
jgi:aspartate dehydrogenase|tara:strand:+ start:1818 stop:2645 length:828 start_codon:yes stop_codon:yes gene_type:complete